MPASSAPKPDTHEISEDKPLIFVMPKEFRGRDGLARASAQESSAKPLLAPSPLPASPKRITPTQTVLESKLNPPPIPVRRVSRPLLVVGALLLLVLGGIGLWWSFYKPAASPVALTQKPLVAPALPPVNIPVPKPLPLPVPRPAFNPFEGEVLPGQDTDSDGLTDVEEVLYATISTRPDTDGDGYLDGNEVFHLYHPNGTAPQTLLDTGAVSVFSQASFPFRVHVLKRWITEVNSTGALTTKSPTGESFEVGLAQLLPPGLQSFTTKSGFPGHWSTDRLTAYVQVEPGKLLSFAYRLGSAQRVEYRQTFEMFMNSLERARP